ALDAHVPDLRERRDDDGNHAGDRHPPPVHELRRVVDARHVRGRRARAQRPHAKIQLAMSSSIWEDVEPLLAHVQKPARYIGGEDGALAPVHAPHKVAWLLTYPDSYEIGLPNQG